ncbi:MAG: peptidylprolyl isomerase [Pseudomonadota bacterium]
MGKLGLWLSMAALTTSLVLPLQMAEAQVQETPFRPVAVVNGSAVTGYDIAQRAQILVVSGFRADDAQQLQREALNRLIEDRLKLQEGARFGITPTEEIVQSGLEEFAQRAGVSVNELRALTSARGLGKSALEDMVSAEIIWRQVVLGRFSQRIRPTDAEVDAEIALASGGSDRRYRVLEIGLPAEDAGRSDADTLALATQLSDDLNGGADFVAAVRQHSRSPSASRDGEIGWISSDRLPPDLAQALGQLEPGDVSEPLKVAGGYSLLKVLDIRGSEDQTAQTADPNLRARVTDQIANERMQRLADGLLQELRREALIELR